MSGKSAFAQGCLTLIATLRLGPGKAALAMGCQANISTLWLVPRKTVLDGRLAIEIQAMCHERYASLQLAWANVKPFGNGFRLK